MEREKPGIGVSSEAWPSATRPEAEQQLATAFSERKRIARELHDGLGQRLASIAIVLGAAEKLMGHDVPRAREEVRVAREMLRSTLEEVRRIVHDLRPAELEDAGLAESLARYVRQFNEAGEEMTQIDVRGTQCVLAPETEHALFRVAQESLQNIRRHARARHAWVRLEFQREEIILRVEDDGIGFHREEAEMRHLRGTSFGLKGMAERVDLLRGRFLVESAPGQGTRVEVRIPLVDP